MVSSAPFQSGNALSSVRVSLAAFHARRFSARFKLRQRRSAHDRLMPGRRGRFVRARPPGIQEATHEARGTLLRVPSHAVLFHVPDVPERPRTKQARPI